MKKSVCRMKVFVKKRLCQIDNTKTDRYTSDTIFYINVYLEREIVLKFCTIYFSYYSYRYVEHFFENAKFFNFGTYSVFYKHFSNIELLHKVPEQ